MSLRMTGLRLLPKNALSRAAGAVLGAPWPRPVLRAAIRGFARAWDVNLAEAERDPDAYGTFTDFFTRRLKPGARPVVSEPDLACSPCDGALGECGVVAEGALLQAKGRPYGLRELLADDGDARAFEGGSYATIYLSPRDYHRVHFPVSGRVTGYTLVPGHLWPVNAMGVAEIDRLFAVNERLITHVEGESGRVAIVMVGATVVGKIRVTYDDVTTNRASERRVRRERLRQPVEVRRGDECGVFEAGSTVLVLFEKERAELLPGMEPGRRIRFGEGLARLAAAHAAGTEVAGGGP